MIDWWTIGLVFVGAMLGSALGSRMYVAMLRKITLRHEDEKWLAKMEALGVPRDMAEHIALAVEHDNVPLAATMLLGFLEQKYPDRFPPEKEETN
jgi:hypothetical protein